MSIASLLMSVYSKVSPDALKECLFSLADQTLLPEQFVIVKDGPLTTELEVLIDQFTSKFASLTLIVNIEINQGLIKALNTGLQHCTQEWIIRMDSDDVAMPDRIERQINFLKENPDIDVLGSAMLEFESSPKKPQRLKPVKSSHEDIAKQLPFRNPINHPSACIRKSTLLDIGGYPSLYLLEDYFLWAKLINECKLRWWIYQHQLSRPWGLFIGISLQCLIRFSPLFLHRYLWHASRQQLPAQDG